MSFRTKTNVQEGKNRVGEIKVNLCDYGTPVPDILGTSLVTPNIINVQDIKSTKHESTTTISKGIFGLGKVKLKNITYTYSLYLELAIAETADATATRVLRTWINDSLSRDKDEFNGVVGQPLTIKQAKSYGDNRSDYMKTNHPDINYNYNSLLYAYGPVYLGTGVSIPSYKFEVAGFGTTDNTAGDGVDITAADYIQYIINKLARTLAPGGTSILPHNVTIEGLDNYRSYCKAADILMSTPVDFSSATAQEIINRILQLSNASMFWAGDRYKIVVLETRTIGDWVPDNTIKCSLGVNDFIEQDDGALVTYQRKPSSELYNRFTASYTNRDALYESYSVSYTTQGNSELREADDELVEYFFTEKRVLDYLHTKALKNKYERNKYTFQLNPHFQVLEPGDIVAITDNAIGVNETPVRITSITEEENGVITVEAVSMVPFTETQKTAEVPDVVLVDTTTNKPADVTDAPLFYQPPAEFEANALYVAMRSENYGSVDENWGGAVVWVSYDNVTYSELDTQYESAKFGELASDCTSTSTSITIRANGSWDNVTAAQRNADLSAVRVGNEIISYRTRTYNTDGTITLGDCLRGRYNTESSEHIEGESVLKLDGNYVAIELDDGRFGNKIYVKLQSFNSFKNEYQDLASCIAYSYTPAKITSTAITSTGAEATLDAMGTTTVSWSRTSTRVLLYELRTNQNPGSSAGMLTTTSNTSVSLDGLAVGTKIYLYGVLVDGNYSAPTVATVTDA